MLLFMGRGRGAGTKQHSHTCVLCPHFVVGGFFSFSFSFCFVLRGEGRKRGRETSWVVSCVLPGPGPEPATQACALTWNQTSNLSLCGTTPKPLSHTGQGLCCHFERRQRFQELFCPREWVVGRIIKPFGLKGTLESILTSLRATE